MNAVEIEETVSQLSVAPFEQENFTYAFLKAFGNKKYRDTAFKKLLSIDVMLSRIDDHRKRLGRSRYNPRPLPQC